MTHIDANGHAHRPTGEGGGQFTSKATSAPIGSLTHEQINRAQKTMENTARKVVRTYRIDESNVEDIVQDSWIQLLAREDNKGDLSKRIDESAFLKHVANIRGTKYGEGGRYGMRSEDAKARRELFDREDAFKSDNGRAMNNAERNAAAEDIRMNMFSPGTRPKADFHQPFTLMSLDAPVVSGGSGGEDSTLGDVIEADLGAEEPDERTQREERASHLLHDLNNEWVTKGDARKEIWNILTTSRSAPAVKRGSMKVVEGREAKRLVADAGGVNALTNAWLDGEITEEQEEALFSPFTGSEEGSPLNFEERELVVDVLDEHQGRAEAIWNASVLAASTSNV